MLCCGSLKYCVKLKSVLGRTESVAPIRTLEWHGFVFYLLLVTALVYCNVRARSHLRSLAGFFVQWFNVPRRHPGASRIAARGWATIRFGDFGG